MEEKEKKSIFKKWWFWVIALFVIGIIVSSLNDNKEKAQVINETKTQPIATTQQKQIPYEIVKRWTIPNGGEGKLVVISPDNLNETDMVALGENLRNDTKNDRNAFISIFDDKKAISLRDTVLSDKASVADQNFYDKHFIGEYDRNINTGYNEFQIFFDGVMGTNQKIIKY